MWPSQRSAGVFVIGSGQSFRAWSFCKCRHSAAVVAVAASANQHRRRAHESKGAIL